MKNIKMNRHNYNPIAVIDDYLTSSGKTPEHPGHKKPETLKPNPNEKRQCSRQRQVKFISKSIFINI